MARLDDLRARGVPQPHRPQQGMTPAALAWGVENLAASQSDITMDLVGITQVTQPWDGSVIGFSIRSNEARTAGSATFQIVVNGSGVGDTLVLDATNTQKASKVFANGAVAFTAGDTLGVKFTTDASWAPTTADVGACIWMEYRR